MEIEKKKNRLRIAKLKAMNALPNKRRLEAMNEQKNNQVPPPNNRPLWTHHPPIKGFSLSNLTETAAEKAKEAQQDQRE